MKNRSNSVTILIFILLIYSISILNIFNKDKEFSPNENRYLVQKPQFSLRGVLDGQYGNDFERYLNDQFIFRDWWISQNSTIQINLFKKDINGVYIGKDGYLIEKHLEDDFDNNQFKKILIT